MYVEIAATPLGSRNDKQDWIPDRVRNDRKKRRKNYDD